MLLRVSIPFNAKNEYVREFKQAHRRDDDIAIVNAGMRVHMTRAMSGGSKNPSCPCVCACLMPLTSHRDACTCAGVCMPLTLHGSPALSSQCAIHIVTKKCS